MAGTAFNRIVVDEVLHLKIPEFGGDGWQLVLGQPG